MVLQAYAFGGQNVVAIHADRAEFGHIRRHLAPVFAQTDSWSSLEHIGAGMDEFWPGRDWALETSGLESSQALTHGGLTEREAQCLLATLQHGGNRTCRLVRPLHAAQLSMG